MGPEKCAFSKATAKLGQIFETAKFISLKSLKDKDFLNFMVVFVRFGLSSQNKIKWYAREAERHSNQRYQV